MKNLEFSVNGKRVQVESSPDRMLLSVLRYELDLTGAKYGCGEGQCGACTVLINGQATRSCVTPLSAVQGKTVITIEGLEKNGRLHAVQAAFIETGAMQCGYCIPGMIMSAVGLLDKKQNPTDQEIMRSMEGNICRCGTYPRVVEAIRIAAKSVKGGAR